VLGAWSLMRDQRGAVGGPAPVVLPPHVEPPCPLWVAPRALRLWVAPPTAWGGREQALTGRMPGEALKPHALLRVAPHA
jgi:hypothetical protein